MSWLVGYLSGLLGYILASNGYKWLSIIAFIVGAYLVYMMEQLR